MDTLLPNHVAASDALRLNCDSRNFGPNVDMPAMRVASVAPAKHRNRKVGFFRRSSTDLEIQRKKEGGREVIIIIIINLIIHPERSKKRHISCT